MKGIAVFVLNHAVVLLFALVICVFGLLAPDSLAPEALENLFVQASSTAVLAAGMTFVLLVAGVDLSVGAIMAVTAAIAGRSMASETGVSVPVAIALIAGIGLLFGIVNGLIVTRLGVAAFIATLGTLWIGRGAALWITQTRAINLPDAFLQLGSSRLGGVPVPILVCGAILAAGHLTLTRTPFGRQLFAIGHNRETALRAGINTRLLIAATYAICGLCAAAGGVLALAQLGSVSPTFGLNREFGAIAAAVLGGTSLFGGRGSILPGSLLGAALIQSVENGLVVINADPYSYPLVTSGVIFLAVLLDSLRQRVTAGRPGTVS